MNEPQHRETKTVSRVEFGNILPSPSEDRIHAENKSIIDQANRKSKGWYVGLFFGRK